MKNIWYFLLSWISSSSPLAADADGSSEDKESQMEDHHLHGRIEDFNGVQKELFDSMTPDQRALVQFARTNAIYDLVRNHTTEVCPMQRETCNERFEKIERRTGKAAIAVVILFVATTAWAAGAGHLPTEAIANLLSKLIA